MIFKDAASIMMIDLLSDHDDSGVECGQAKLGNILKPRIELRTWVKYKF
jgi:hypothetical protein